MWVILSRAKTSVSAPLVLTTSAPSQTLEVSRQEAELCAKRNPASSYFIAELIEEVTATVNVERKAIV